jgi:hypothetical protein
MGTERPASPALEAFIDEGIKLSKERGYNPTIFIGMRHQYGTVDAIERLVSHHSDFDVLIPSHSRIGKFSAGRRISMLLGTPG